MKEWKRYLIYVVCIFVYISLSAFIYYKINSHSNTTGSIDFYVAGLVPFCVNTIFGVLLGMEHFIKMKKGTGMWKLNTTRLLIVGVPSFILSLYYFFYHSNIRILIDLTDLLPNEIMLQKPFMNFVQILLGYIVITSFIKKNKEIL
ncbi:MAG: hypothetical protein Q8920_10080 [Bacillota bacterium]|nr:hypothetical protein [Bacillota bacterium]